jgi:serine/threonine protein kinase
MTQSPPPAPSRSTGPGTGTASSGAFALGAGLADFASLPLALALCLEEVCARFEAAWHTAGAGGTVPRLEAFLATAPEEGRPALLRELVRIDLAYRRAAGSLPDPEEYLQRFPGLDRGWLIGARAAAAAATAPRRPETGTTDSGTSRTLRPPATSGPLPVRFDDFELLEEVARGGMGVVYRARQLSLNRVVAVKMILDRTGLTEEAIHRFHREARAAGALDHPNIVAVYTSGQYDGRPYFVMAYVEGDNLRAVVRRDGLPPPQRAADLLRDVADAVACAHRLGIIHRDLKPENVLLDRQGRPRVTDFGLAYRPEAPAAGERLTQEGQVLGTPAYMSPEQALSRHEAVGPATDVYSLGGILYFLLTGRPPFQGRSATEVLCRVVTEAPTPPRQVNPQVPAGLEAVCLRCLEKEPARRYPSAEALAEALRAAGTPPEEAVARPPAPRPAGRWWSRRAGVGLAAVGVLGLAAGVWLTAPVLVDGPPAVPPSPDADPTPARAALEPPSVLRKDFGLEVTMVGKSPGDNRLVALQPGPDGLIRLRPGGEVKFKVKVAQEAYVGIWAIDAGGTEIQELFPNENEKDHLFRQDQERQVPVTTAEAVASKGTDWVWILASKRPWDPLEGHRQGPFHLFQDLQEREQWENRQRTIRLRTGGALAEEVLRFRVD